MIYKENSGHSVTPIQPKTGMHGVVKGKTHLLMELEKKKPHVFLLIIFIHSMWKKNNKS